MKLRTKLVVWFLLVAVLPLAGIVLYSYFSSLRTLRRAAVAEAGVLTAEIGTRMESVRERVGVGVRALGDLSFKNLLAAPAETGDDLQLISRLEIAMGEMAPFVDSLEFIPAEPPPPAEAASRPPAPPGPPPSEPVASGVSTQVRIVVDDEQSATMEMSPFVIFLDGGEVRPVEGTVGQGGDGAELALEWLTSEEGRELLEVFEERMDGLAGLLAEGDEAAGPLIKAAVEEVTLREGFQTALAEHERAARELEARLERGHEDLERHSREKRGRIMEYGRLGQDELDLLEGRKIETERILGRQFDCAVESDGKEVGRLRAQIGAKKLLMAVLSQARRDQGEVPFAIDSAGKVYVAAAGDLERLEDLPLAEEWKSDRDVDRRDLGDWVVVRSRDAESDLIYGIARPLHQSLTALRRTAGRNFAWGLGLVGLALVGIAPMSKRITRDLSDLRRGAELLAAGDLGTRVPVRSRDEVGHLAVAFNNMAEELCENQRKLIEEERLRKEQEMERRLLETENARKSEELEEARRFQLSLLPKCVPEHPDLELGVFMETATEVGGDYYDFHLGESGVLTVAIGDATGHGAKAGTMVTVIKSLFTAHGAVAEPQAFLTSASEAIRRMELGRMAMALSLVRFSRGSMKVAAAGMPPVFVRRASDGSIQEVTVEGVPLGAMSSYTYRELEVDLASGDTVLLMSDGFPELANGEGEPLGYGQVRDLFAGCVATTPQGIIDELAEAARQWISGEAPGDDVTFVVVRCK